MGHERSILVITGGGPLPPDVLHGRRFDAVVAADSGLDAALLLGLAPDLLVGDLDSISDAGRQWAEANHVPVERHPVDKDLTDTALALRCPMVRDAAHVTLATPAATGRLDHLLGTLGALGDTSLAHHRTVTALVDHTVAHVVHPGHEVELDLPVGGTFSLVALHGACTGVEVDAARWPLADASLTAGSTLGISNESLGHPVRVAVRTGVLTVVVPPPEPSPRPSPPQEHS